MAETTRLHASLPAGLSLPRSLGYADDLALDLSMGPHPVWLAEWLCQRVDLQPGMRVLDLGCGKGLSSLFLAQEFGVQVWAVDLWISATENAKRFRSTGVEDQVFAIHADARDLPFAHGFFDAILCVDSYIYFGTDDLALPRLVEYVKPGGPIGMVVPGFMSPINGCLPDHLRPFWAQECWTWHTVQEWRWMWERTELVDVDAADAMPDGWRMWRVWEEAVYRRHHPDARSDDPGPDARVLDIDRGRTMGFIRMVGRRRACASA